MAFVNPSHDDERAAAVSPKVAAAAPIAITADQCCKLARRSKSWFVIVRRYESDFPKAIGTVRMANGWRRPIYDQREFLEFVDRYMKRRRKTLNHGGKNLAQWRAEQRKEESDAI